MNIPDYHAIVNNAIAVCQNTCPEEFPSLHGIQYGIYSFPQTWPSTALGFSGVGGGAMTDAQTTVIRVSWYNKENKYREFFAVYFDNTLAYSVRNPSKMFYDDMHSLSMASCSGAFRYSGEMYYS